MIIERSVVLLVSSYVEMSISASSIWYLSKCRDARPFAFNYIWVCLVLTLSITTAHTQTPGFHIEPTHNVLFGDSMTDAGTKFMWIAEKGALRAGKVDGTEWDLDSIGAHSVAFGLNNQVKGSGSVSWGFDNTTSGPRSATWGFGNTTSGTYSATWGLGNTTSGATSATWGLQNKNQSLAETVIGRYADTVATASASIWQAEDQLLAVGNGSADDARNNAFTIMKNGRIGLNNNAPATDIHIKQSSGTGGITLEHASDADTWLIHQASIDNLNFVFNGTLKGHIDEATGNYVQGSDIRLKKNIEPVGVVLDMVAKLEPSLYHYTTMKDTESKTLGLIAQDVLDVFPYLVHEGDDDMLALSYSNMSVLAIKAIQEQQEIIENQSDKLIAQQLENQELKSEVDSLSKRLLQLEKLINEKI